MFMSSDQTTQNPAEALALKPIGVAVSIVAIALMFSLATNSVVRGVYAMHAEYTAIIVNQELQLAGVGAALGKSMKEEKVAPSGEAKETNRIIVKYKEKDLPLGLTIAAERANIEKAQGLKELLTIKGINSVVYEVAEADTAGEVIDRLMASKKDLIEYAEVDMLVPPALIPNDPLFTNQWHHNNVQTATAWDIAQGEGVTVAILDTGVNRHEDLTWSAVPAKNFHFSATDVNDVTDVYGHGTQVAGTAAATGNNAVGVAGIAPKALVLPLRISGTDGLGSFSAMANALVYAADNGARVANISYAVCGTGTVLDAARYMRNKGGVVTISAGNSGGEYAFLATDAATCSSATASNDLRTSWSTYGAFVDVSSPGAGIYTTSASGGYSAPSGTSFSSPLTAGIYALMFSVNPSLTPNQADSILYSTADDIGEPGWDQYYGYGRVNAAKAVAAAKAAVGTRDAIAPSAPGNLKAASVSSNAIALTWTASTDDNSGVAGYSIYRNGTKLTTIAGTSYTSIGLTPLTAYSYTVKAEDVAGNVSVDSNKLDVTTPDVAFGISSYSVPTKTAITATITANLTKLGTVVVKYGTTAANLVGTASSATAATTHTLSLSGLSAFTTYYYQVVATDASGTVVTSAVSSFKTNKATGGGKPQR